jgi:hypothetical protein
MDDFIDIIGFEGTYQINRDGVVKTISTTRDCRYYGTIKKPYADSRGYCAHKFWKDGKFHHKLLHRLMAEAFIPNPENKPTVDHIDRNPSNNVLTNLRWATHTEQLANQERSLQSLSVEEKRIDRNKKKNDWKIRNKIYLVGAKELRDIQI